MTSSRCARAGHAVFYLPAVVVAGQGYRSPQSDYGAAIVLGDWSSALSLHASQRLHIYIFSPRKQGEGRRAWRREGR